MSNILHRTNRGASSPEAAEEPFSSHPNDQESQSEEENWDAPPAEPPPPVSPPVSPSPEQPAADAPVDPLPQRTTNRVVGRAYRSKNGTLIWRGGAKPFGCAWEGCDYACVQSCNLTSHMRTHMGKKLYKCTWEDCDCAFNPGESPASSAETAEQSSSKGKKRSAPNKSKSNSKKSKLCQTNSTPGQVKAFCCFSYVMALVHSFTCVSLLLLLLPKCQTFFTERIVERLPRKLLKNLLLQTQTTKNRSPRRRRIK